jgi:hypothetical protein
MGLERGFNNASMTATPKSDFAKFALWPELTDHIATQLSSSQHQ